MSEHVVKILKANYIMHDVKRFVTEKPLGYDFIPGQATDISINLKGWKDNLHPFTFTSLREWDDLEFIIKIYQNPKGVTNKLGSLNAGAELILHDVFGTIQYSESGVFIAAGAGITPFISIFRDLRKRNRLLGNKLIYSNKTSKDVILDEELTDMFHEDFIKVFTQQGVIGFHEGRIDRDYLIEKVQDFGQHFYLCGPDEFVKNIKSILLSLGAKADAVVFEQ